MLYPLSYERFGRTSVDEARSAQLLEVLECRGHAPDPHAAVVHLAALHDGHERAVIDLGDDSGTFAVGLEVEGPPVPPLGRGRVRHCVRVTQPGLGLPRDAPVRLELDHAVVHLVVAEPLEVHLDHEDIADRRDERGW